jgi:cytochrome P450
LESEKDPENMTDQYLRDITLNFIIAGKDTSANTLAWFFYMLCKHPLVQEKVVKEVREAVGIKESMSADEFSKLMTEEALDKMQYLHASLTETLRLYPAVPLVKYLTIVSPTNINSQTLSSSVIAMVELHNFLYFSLVMEACQVLLHMLH